mmetsp:Transcript_47783/g.125138  ORF Transcript_47783/g.125138 Transcript_47783/m.125138 type:complete len:223 (-) Transcript_47783:1204-1872(-)
MRPMWSASTRALRSRRSARPSSCALSAAPPATTPSASPSRECACRSSSPAACPPSCNSTAPSLFEHWPTCYATRQPPLRRADASRCASERSRRPPPSAKPPCRPAALGRGGAACGFVSRCTTRAVGFRRARALRTSSIGTRPARSPQRMLYGSPRNRRPAQRPIRCRPPKVCPLLPGCMPPRRPKVRLPSSMWWKTRGGGSRPRSLSSPPRASAPGWASAST